MSTYINIHIQFQALHSLMRYSNTFLFSEDISRFQVTHMSISIIYFYRVLQLIFKSTGGCFFPGGGEKSSGRRQAFD